MREQRLLDDYGNIKMRVKLPIYDEWDTPISRKNVNEDLAFVKGGNSETSKIIINAFTSLYRSFEIDPDKTYVSYSIILSSYVEEVSFDEYKIVTPENTTWSLNLHSMDALKNSFSRNIGYIVGDLTPIKAQIFDRLARKLTNLSTNTYTDTYLTANFKPYKGSG